jgi:hypothetical protein
MALLNQSGRGRAARIRAGLYQGRANRRLHLISKQFGVRQAAARFRWLVVAASFDATGERATAFEDNTVRI